MSTYPAGSLVRARGREWVVLPESEPDFLVLRPLGGTDEERAGVHLGLEQVQPASFALPTADDLGDFQSARLLRDAVRLGFRNGAGPFRSFARLACEPRPYQLVPLLMALRQDPVRLLIADDVGIGKTVEACLVARELLDRQEAKRLAVLCPPHLAEQWQTELRRKFNIEAEVVLPGTARRLEARCLTGQSLFDVYPHVVVSTDFIKSDVRRHDFLRACPELVIVDEAHTCAAATYAGSRHQRHLLLKGLSENPGRHLILVTATPHSGKDDAFESLLGLLDPGLAALPRDLSGEANRKHRERLAGFLVQRRRGDIRKYLGADTPFPEREEKEETYRLSPDYRKLLERALDFARELVQDTEGGQLRRRIRWWSALALLRSISSSPAAAAATLHTRGHLDEAETEEDVDSVGEREVLDAIDDAGSEGSDVAPGSVPGEAEEERTRRRFAEMEKQAKALAGEDDTKLRKATKIVKELLSDGFRPIVFCRFIPTAEYVAEQLRERLPKNVEVAAVTGLLPPDEREARVLELAESEKRVLVCTDCLSEGINLQDHFDAAVHYDLAWNPTRHEQREGRVDRYGQLRSPVRVVTLYGEDNPVDGVVLEVLLRKHRAIRSTLGISVPVPMDTEKTMAAIFHAALMRRDRQLTLGFEASEAEELGREWTSAAERERQSRTLFAQHAISTTEVAAELDEARRAIGSGVDVARFVCDAVVTHRGQVTKGVPTILRFKEAPAALKDAVGIDNGNEVPVRFELPVAKGEHHLHRTHPLVSGLASFVLDTALDPVLGPNGAARRAGVMVSRAVDDRTVLLLLRLRYRILTELAEGTTELLAEESRMAAFRGSPADPRWLDEEEAEKLLAVTPDRNLAPEMARVHLAPVADAFAPVATALERIAHDRAKALLGSHRRVRQAQRLRAARQHVEPRLPVDVLGLYVCLPA